MKERILCAAIHYTIEKSPVHSVRNSKEYPGVVICGFRHANCIGTWNAITGLSTYGEEQGFLTSKNNFVDRTEAMIIALAACQVKDGHKERKELYSEDLY